MLVLRRRIGEEVYIDGGKIRVAVLSIIGGVVRLGFAAPPEIVVDREEIHHLKHETTWGLNVETQPGQGAEGGKGGSESVVGTVGS